MQRSKLNILPVPTFSWLGVNDIFADISEYENEISIANNENDKPVRINVASDKIYKISVTGSSSTFVILYDNLDNNFRLDVSADDNSSIKLVEVFDNNTKTISQLNASISENATLDLVQIYLNSSAVNEIAVELNGRKSKINVDIAYILEGSNELDINLIADHFGKKSESNINVKGVLDGRSSKTFKGTIDFKNGSVGAVGAEKEDVLLLSDSVVNKTVPLILCAEEDVEGSHGASIGRVDENELFYMQSRGIPEEKIVELMAHSKIAQVIKKIGDEETEKQIYRKLGRGEDDE